MEHLTIPATMIDIGNRMIEDRMIKNIPGESAGIHLKSLLLFIRLGHMATVINVMAVEILIMEGLAVWPRWNAI
jgi:hypothetical protein